MKTKPRVFFHCGFPTDSLVTTDKWFEVDDKICHELENFTKNDFKGENSFAFKFLSHTEKLIQKAGDISLATNSTSLEINSIIDELRKEIKSYESWRIVTQTLKLSTIAYRLGAMPSMAQKAVKESRVQAKKATKPRTRKGLTPKDQEERNKKIVADYRANQLKKSPLSISGFAQRHSEKYNLKPRKVREILTESQSQP